MIRKFLCNKLIRDKMPEILSKNQIFTKTKILNNDEILVAIKNKLIEEAKEVATAQTKEDLTQELADVLTACKAIAKKHNILEEDVQKAMRKKDEEKGTFSNYVFCEFIELDETNPKIQYYRSKKDEYPEIDS